MVVREVLQQYCCMHSTETAACSHPGTLHDANMNGHANRTFYNSAGTTEYCSRCTARSFTGTRPGTRHYCEWCQKGAIEGEQSLISAGLALLRTCKIYGVALTLVGPTEYERNRHELLSSSS